MCITSTWELAGVKLNLRARIDVSRGKLEIQEISIPQRQSVAYEVIKGLGTFRKASRSTVACCILLHLYSPPWV